MRDRIGPAETAVGAYAYGLEDLGITVSIFDLYRDDPRLIVPADADIEQHKHHLFTGETGGGTPLHKPVALADEHLQGTADFSFILCITDGKPKPVNAYTDAVDNAISPVVGITLALGDSQLSQNNHQQYYSHHRTISTVSELQTQLEELACQLIFQ
jgi:hypothetical protein